MTDRCICAAVALLLPIGVAGAVEPPQLQEGLWEIHTQTIANPGNKKDEGTHKVCRDHAYDKAADALGKNVKDGPTFSFESVGGGKYSLESRGTVNGIAIVTKGTATYQGGTSIHAEYHTTYTPAFYGQTDGTMIMDQKYLGSCPAGTKPGDRIA
jgi:hypothetical protein